MDTELLKVSNLHSVIRTSGGPLRAVDGVSFSILPRRTLGLVGESGCGKTVTALSILRLLLPPVYIESGSILFHSRRGNGMANRLGT